MDVSYDKLVQGMGGDDLQNINLQDPITQKLAAKERANRNERLAEDAIKNLTNGVAPKDFDIWSNKNYKWFTGSDDNERQKIPYVILVEFENRTDVVLQRQLYVHMSTLARAERTNSPNFKDLYGGLYLVVPTGRSFRVPYLGKTPFAINTAYSMIDTKSTEGLGDSVLKARSQVYDSIQQAINGFSNLVTATTKSQEGLRKKIMEMANNPSQGTEGFQRRFGITEGAQSIKKWTSAEGSQFTTKFVLVNDTPQHISNNYFFVRDFLRALSPAFPNTMEVRVPYLYEIYIPSQLHIPLGFIGKFTATPKGVMYMASEKMVIPEAWEIEMAFNSLFPLSKQLLDTIDEPVGANFGFNTSVWSGENVADGRYSSIVGVANTSLTDTDSYKNFLKQMTSATMAGYNIPTD